jgi:hypothetical protein
MDRVAKMKEQIISTIIPPEIEEVEEFKWSIHVSELR